MKWRFVALAIVIYPALVLAEEYFIEELGERWLSDDSTIIDFVDSIPNRERLEDFDPYCRKLAAFLWYESEICA